MSLTQNIIDKTRARVMLHLARTLLDPEAPHLKGGKVWHLWFFEDSDNSYEMRSGNAPSDTDRPCHLKGKRLWIDLKTIPEWLKEHVKPGGLVDKRIDTMVDELGLPDTENHKMAIRTKVFGETAERMVEKGLFE